MIARLNDFLEETKIINKLLALKSIIDCYKLKRKPIFTCFIDFKKADSASREGLYYKLILLCGRGKSFLKCICLLGIQSN